MKKLLALGLATALLLTGCNPGFSKKEEVVQDAKSTDEKPSIVPKYKISDSYYQTILPFKPGESRGLTVARLNTRYDIDEFETGLMRQAKETFATDEYLYQEGQYLKKQDLTLWLQRKMSKAQLKAAKLTEDENIGINPQIGEKGSNEELNTESPIYLANILEHDYLKRTGSNKVRLGGISIGLALNSVHYYNTKEGYPREVQISQAKLNEVGKRLADAVVKRVRNVDGLSKVPIVIALFRQESRDSIKPGHFFASTVVDEGESVINKWEEVDEKYFSFPSEDATKNNAEDATNFNGFRQDIETYFPNYTGVVGRGFYRDGQLAQLSIDIPMQFYGKGEVIGFTQYVTGLAIKYFPDYFALEINISSVGGPESLIIRKEGQETPTVHIYQ